MDLLEKLRAIEARRAKLEPARRPAGQSSNGCSARARSSSTARLRDRIDGVADRADSHGDEERTIALWQGLLTAGLYVNLIVPPGCAQDEYVLRASCSAARTPEQLTRALDIFGRVGAEFGVTHVALS
jgi:hypothetical protein